MSQTLSGRAPITVQAKTAAYTITTAENGTCFTNTGATAARIFSLPPATPGLHYYFSVGAAFALQIDPDGTETISLPSNGVPGAGGKYLEADAVGESVRLVCCVAGNWACFGYTGTWTAQA